MRWQKFAPGPVRVIAVGALQAAQRVQIAAIQKRVRDRAAKFIQLPFLILI